MGFALSGMKLESPAFKTLDRIPQKHTGEGENISPALEWGGAPEGTRSFALVCHDPDAPRVSPGAYGFVHWVLYNIPNDITGLLEDTKEFTMGLNDRKQPGYTGPHPPAGHGTHHYFFLLMALDMEPNLESGLSLWDLLGHIEPHVIGMNRLVGTYER